MGAKAKPSHRSDLSCVSPLTYVASFGKKEKVLYVLSVGSGMRFFSPVVNKFVFSLLFNIIYEPTPSFYRLCFPKWTQIQNKK